jgi:putative FmdB family regulatory protein
MPLYAYECTNCGVAFERQQKFTDNPIKRCPECGKNAVRRVIQPSGIIFKGSGWYKTDSRSSSSESSSTPKAKKSSAKTDGKSESKTESKTETKSSDSSSTPAAPAASTSSKSSSSSDSD